jgi:uncharacterized iron-regulated protein
MFFRPYQGVLDAYVRGDIDEPTMLERTEWKTRWGFGWEMYAPMVRLARERGVRVLALNAPKEVTRTISRKGTDGLSPEQRASLPALDLANADHRAFVKRAFGAHGASMPEEKFDRFYTAMVVWDETMSSVAADWLVSNGPESRILVVAGNGHVADRYGVPDRTRRKCLRPGQVIAQHDGDGGASTPEEAASLRSPAHADFTAWWPEPPPKAPRPKASPPAPAPPAEKPAGAAP